MRNVYQRQLTTEVKLLNAIDANWDPCIKTIPIRRGLISIAFSNNGVSIAVVSIEHVSVFEAVTGVAIFEVQESAQSISFSPEDDMLVCGLKDGSAKVWDVRTRNLIQKFEGHTRMVTSVAFSPCGTMMASGSSDATVRIWNISSGYCKCVLEGHLGWVLAVCWSGTGDRVISGSKDSTGRIWDISKQTCSKILREHTGWVTSVASLPGSSSVASGSWDKTVKIYDSRSGDVLRAISTDDHICSIQFSTHGDKLLYTNQDSASILDLTTNMRVAMINCNGRDATFSSDGTRAAWELNDEMKIWDIENGYSNSEAVNHHLYPVKVFSFAPDERLMASGSQDVLKVWDLATGECLFTHNSDDSILSTVFSPDSAFLVCLFDHDIGDDRYGRVMVWNVHTHSLIKIMDLKNNTYDVALSPGGGILASISSSHVSLWNLGNGKRLANLSLYPQFLSDFRIGFSADGYGLYVVKDNRYIRSWRISKFVTRLSDRDTYPSKNRLSSPLVLLPMQEELSHEDLSMPRQYCRYGNGDEWIFDQHGRRILWVPPDRRRNQLIRFHGEKVAFATYRGRIYVADFSDALVRARSDDDEPL
jgi:WD40 repeat protein